MKKYIKYFVLFVILILIGVVSINFYNKSKLDSSAKYKLKETEINKKEDTDSSVKKEEEKSTSDSNEKNGEINSNSNSSDENQSATNNSNENSNSDVVNSSNGTTESGSENSSQVDTSKSNNGSSSNNTASSSANYTITYEYPSISTRSKEVTSADVADNDSDIVSVSDEEEEVGSYDLEVDSDIYEESSSSSNEIKQNTTTNSNKDSNKNTNSNKNTKSNSNNKSNNKTTKSSNNKKKSTTNSSNKKSSTDSNQKKSTTNNTTTSTQPFKTSFTDYTHLQQYNQTGKYASYSVCASGGNTIGGTGCGLSAYMATRYILTGKDTNYLSFAREACNTGFYNGNGTSWEISTGSQKSFYENKYGITSTEINGTYTNIVKQLKKNRVVVMIVGCGARNVDAGGFNATGNWHFVVLAGYREAKDKIYVYNPNNYNHGWKSKEDIKKYATGCSVKTYSVSKVS